MTLFNSSRAKQASTQTDTRRNTLTLHGANVAMAPARSVTSHARRAYAERYAGRYRFSRAVFGFDLFLVALAAALMVVDLVFLFGSAPRESGVELTFAAPPLKASDEMPVSVTLRAVDGAIHEDVRLQWHVPEWAEIVRAVPPLTRDGSVLLGRIEPGVDRQSYVALRLRALPGTRVPFGVTVSQLGRFGLQQRVIGSETRTIISSAVSAELPVHMTQVVPGASVPIAIRNSGAHAISVAVFRITDGPGTIAGSSNMVLGALAPSSTRIVFVSLPATLDDAVHLAWQLEDRGQVIAASSAQLRVDSAFPLTLTGPPVRNAETETNMHASYAFTSETSTGSLLFVIHRGDGSTFSRFLEVSPDRADTTANFLSEESVSSTWWSVTPFVKLASGGWTVGMGSSASVSNIVPFDTVARYYSASGDQIGVGPLLPVVGRATRYWIVWSINPGAFGLKDVTLRGALPPGVRATGQFASTQSGTFTGHDGLVAWSAPMVPPSTGEPVTFAFEAEITPTTQTPTIVVQGGQGAAYPLIATSTLEALDGKTGAAVHATSAGDFSTWTHDLTALAHLSSQTEQR